MRSLDSETTAALAASKLIARSMIWIAGRDFSTGDIVYGGYWNGNETITTNVVDADTLTLVSRTYTGLGSFLTIDDIPFTSDLTVRSFNATLSGVSSYVLNLVRGYDLKGQPVQIHRAILDPSTRALVAPPFPRFIGYIDGNPIITPAESNDLTVNGNKGNEGSLMLALVSHTSELTRANSDTGSDKSQKRRSATDNFLQDVAVVGQQEMFWGENKGRVTVPTTAVSTTGLSASKPGWKL